MKAVHLRPLSSFNNPFPPSDTLFGAICWGIKFIHGEKELEDLLSDFKKGEPPFKISSVFPIKNSIYYLPAPMITSFSDEDVEDFEDMWRIKESKKKVWLSLGDFNDLINGEKEIEDILEGCKEVKFVKDMIQPGNSVNRLSSATEGNLFFRSVYRHTENTGLYFLLDAKNKDIQDKVISGLRFIEDKGIGGGSSTGHGNFEIEKITDFDGLRSPSDAERFMTLSLYIPKKSEWEHFEEDGAEMSYELVKRKGVVEESFSSFENPWKNTVFMFKPGSIFPVIEDNENYGRNPIVNSDDFDVQQYGYAFDIGVDLR